MTLPTSINEHLVLVALIANMEYLFIVVVTLAANKTLQTMIGFGGAFTDAAGINIMSLSTATQQNLLSSYYSKQGKIFMTHVH